MARFTARATIERMLHNPETNPNSEIAPTAGASKRRLSQASLLIVQDPPTPIGPPIRIHSLGRFSVSGMHNIGLGEAGGRTHARALLAITAASNAGVSRDEIIDVLWPGMSESAARNRLYHTMHLVRRSLSAMSWPEEWIGLNKARVQLDPRIYSDASRLDAAAAGSLDRLSDADLMDIIDNCQGDWAPDVDAGGLGHTIRRHLKECHVKLLHEASSRLVQSGDTPARRDMLRRVLQLSTTDEWAYRQLMQIDLDAHRPHAVLRTFELASRELVQQLGLRPSASLSDLASRAASQLDAHKTEDESPEPRNAALVGRESLVRELASDLNAGPGVWNVSGLSGIGKTSLMREVARRVGPLRKDGVRFVSLGDRTDDEAAMTAVLRACKFDVDASVEAGPMLLKLLSARDVLMVIDDVALAPHWQELVDLLQAPLTARVVLVSHTRIENSMLRHVAVPPLAIAALDASIAQARLSPAFTLFQMRSASADGHVPTDAQVREIVELVRRLDGLPLAIELASARTGSMTPGEILRQLDAGTLPSASQLSAPGAVGGRLMDRHRSVAAALDITVSMLTPAGRCAYRVAAVFSGAFHAAQFDVVAHAANLPLCQPGEAALAELVDAGLLTVSEGREFHMLHLPRAHARSLAKSEALWARIERARIDQVIAALENGATHHESPGYTQWMDTVYALHDDALSVLHAAQHTDDARFLRLLVPLVQSWALRGQRHVPVSWFEHGLSAARRVKDAGSEMLILLSISNTLMSLKRIEEALAHTEAAMSLALASDDLVVVSMTVTMRAYVLNSCGRNRESIHMLEDWIGRMPLGTPGHLTLSSALIFKGVVVAGVTPTDREWKASHALRARLAGSLAWRNVLIAVDDCVATLDPQVRLEIADELFSIANEMHTPWLTHHAQYRKAIALLFLDRQDEAAEVARSAYRLAGSAGLEEPMGVACLFLAELSWRDGDCSVAANWLDKVPAVTAGGRDEDRLLCALSLTRAVLAAMSGDKEAAAHHFLKITKPLLAEMRWPNLELAVECGALIANLIGVTAKCESMVAVLVLVAEANKLAPSVQRFRKKYFNLSSEVRLTSAEEVEAASARGRNALCDLFDCLQALEK
jgi:DNA-binding SARP family transcriptional activator/predicted ATPase